MTRNIWRSLLLALSVLLIYAGCGQTNEETGSFAVGNTADSVSVRIVDAGFPGSVTQFRVSVFSPSAQLLGQQTVARGSGEQFVTITGVPKGSAVIRVEALTADGSTQSFFSSPTSVPSASSVTATSTNFVTGPAPSPTPIPSPVVPSPTPLPSATPTPQPQPSISPLPSPTPQPSGAASPGASPAASPLPTPGGSPSPFPSPQPSAAASPGGSPLASGSFSMQSESRPSASPGGRPTVEFIGQGLNWNYVTGTNNCTITATSFNRERVRFNIRGFAGTPTEPGEQFWGCDLGAVANGTLVPGTYTNARRFNTATQPEIDVSGDGRGNNETNGEFTVFEVVFEQGTNRLLRFSADFVQRGGTSPTNLALRGQIRYSTP